MIAPWGGMPFMYACKGQLDVWTETHGFGFQEKLSSMPQTGWPKTSERVCGHPRECTCAEGLWASACMYAHEQRHRLLGASVGRKAKLLWGRDSSYWPASVSLSHSDNHELLISQCQRLQCLSEYTFLISAWSKPIISSLSRACFCCSHPALLLTLCFIREI